MRRIAIIAGGDSSEMPVSLRSAAAVCKSLDKSKFLPTIVSLSSNGWFVDKSPIDKNDFSYLDEHGVRVKFDYALIMIHGTPGENGILQGYFELLGIPYSGCSVEVSALTFNKHLCKVAVSGVNGVNLAKQVYLRRGDKVDAQDVISALGLPLFVKPNASGSSFGVTKVKGVEYLLPAVAAAFTESEAVLMEEFIDGTEVSQGVMVVGGKEYVLPITELVSKNEFFDYQAKYTPGMTNEITPARIPIEVAAEISKTTLEIYKTLGCCGVVRVDYIIKGSKAYFIEVNTVPGMSEASIVPRQLSTIGMTMGQAFELIITEKLLLS
ncbi:MAG: D-alanine--D-alanine ligase [Mucinivorans sp.]